MLTENVGYILKNVDKKMLTTFKKMLTKNDCNISENVDEKIFTTVQKNY
jgi:hypothetical protein